MAGSWYLVCDLCHVDAMIFRYKMPCFVLKIEERHRRQHQSGIGEDAVFTEESDGWWVVLTGNIAIRLGHGEPRLKAGQRITLTLEADD
jgi:hypothetical protein